jgi:cell division protein FtsL
MNRKKDLKATRVRRERRRLKKSVRLIFLIVFLLIIGSVLYQNMKSENVSTEVSKIEEK